ncbi:MAG: hypothetical protein OXI81_03795 [Paracoccaceae bacterium]|nr:hypothetical protein [Paracoccaceae bacterium]
MGSTEVSSRAADLVRFYRALGRLEAAVGGKRRLLDGDGRIWGRRVRSGNRPAISSRIDPLYGVRAKLAISCSISASLRWATLLPAYSMIYWAITSRSRATSGWKRTR